MGTCPRRPERPRNLRNLHETLVKPWRNLSQNLLAAQDEPLGSPRRPCPREPETLRILENLGGTFRGTFWQPKTALPQRTRDTTNLGEPWWNLPRNLLAAQDGSAPENQRHCETWRTLVEPSAEPFGSPRRICPREPETLRNLENLGGTFRGTFWQPKTDLPQRTRDTTKLGEPWWNLPRNLLAAQDGSAPENHRVQKLFCPETLPMAENPKAIAVGEKTGKDFQP